MSAAAFEPRLDLADRSFEVEVDGAGVGHLLFAKPRTDSVFITEIYVSADWRRHGVGTALLDALVEHCPGALIVVSDRVRKVAGDFLTVYMARHPGVIEFAWA